MQMMPTGGRFWNRQYLDFLLKVASVSVTDPLELASMVTMTSPAGESLWNLGMAKLQEAMCGLATLWCGASFETSRFNFTVPLVDPALLVRYFGPPPSAFLETFFGSCA